MINLANFEVGYSHLLAGSSLAVLESSPGAKSTLTLFVVNKLLVVIRRVLKPVTALFLIGSLLAIPSLSSAQKKDVSVITLNECWKYASPDIMNLRPAADRSNLYIAEGGGRVTAISLVSGTRLWSTELGGDIRSNLAVLGSSVYVAASDGQTDAP